jgi:hypothetical protein
MTGGPTVYDVGERIDEVHIVIPPYAEHLRAVRLVAADAGSRAGLDVEETEDFRLAVDELCHALMTMTDHSIVVSFSVGSRRATARGFARRRLGSSPAKLGALPMRILRALADGFELHEDEDRVAFTVVKQRIRAMS